MKKYIQIIVAVFITFVGMFFIYEIVEKKASDKITIDNENFKREYEELNGKINNDKIYPEVKINTDVNIVYKTEDEIVDIIKDGTGVIYFGYPSCPWCRNAVPVLLDALGESSLEEVYYLDVKDIRDTKILDANGKIITKKNGTSGYYKIVEVLYDYLDIYDGLNDDKIKRLYVPSVVFVKNGTVVLMHTDTVLSQKDPYIPLNSEQKQELKDIYLEGIHKVLGDLCDESC